MSHGNNNKKNFEVYPPEEFLAAITQHIPEKSFQMVRYYGWYSNKSRGIRNKQGIERSSHEPVAEPDKGIEILEVSDHQPSRIPSKSWHSPRQNILSLLDRLGKYLISFSWSHALCLVSNGVNVSKRSMRRTPLRVLAAEGR
jgi:hypothetical protein